MPNKVWAQCPCCQKEANGKEEIDAKFGWRDTNKTVPQSYCYSCRSAGCKSGEPCKAKTK